MNANVNMVNVYTVSVEWKNKLAGVRKLNFNVGIKVSRAFYTENKIPTAFPGQ